MWYSMLSATLRNRKGSLSRNTGVGDLLPRPPYDEGIVLESYPFTESIKGRKDAGTDQRE